MQVQKHSFTLIELLTVISIIGILSSIILPALGKAKEDGKQAVCKNNLKQIGYGASMYTSDNDQWYAVNSGNWSTTISNPGGTAVMMGLYGEYTDGAAILYCPSMPDGKIVWLDFSKKHNLPRFKSNNWCQAGYTYRKYSDYSKYHESIIDSGTAFIADSYMDFWGARFGNLTHGADGYTVLYGDSCVSWVQVASRWASSVSWPGNVSMHENDLNSWTLLFDR